MLFGYAGKILHVDLTQGRLRVEIPPEHFYRQYIGGSAMGLYYILKGTKPGVIALGSENILTMMLSAATGAALPGQSRMCANARSPLVDGIGDAQCGGFFPAEMKFAGFDGIVVQGRAEYPVYLWLHDDQAELRPAGHLWGKTTSQVDEILKAELQDKHIEIAQVGPAGEKLCCLAAIINMNNRANGRTGLGAVMGSKNLKAVVVRGTAKSISLADRKKINDMARQGTRELPNNPDVQSLKDFGTSGLVSFQNMLGTLPAYNYSQGQFEQFEAISGETMKETIFKASDTCYACSVRCKRVIETEWENQPVERKHGGPEYETISTFGSYCGISDLNAICYANKLCDEYGLDTIGTGATLAWAMECYEKELLSEAEVGFPLKYGDAHAMTRMLEMLVSRAGFGDILADGSRRAAQRLGKGSQFLITVKGSEAPAHMPQAKRSLGLIYAVNPFGADHQSSEHDPYIEEGASSLSLERLKLIGCDNALQPGSLEGEKVAFALKTQLFYSFSDTACLCQFVWGPAWQLYGPAETVAMLRAVTGWTDFSVEELLQAGERRLNMLRLFNAREGIGRKEDKLPMKFYEPLSGSGPTAGIALDPAELERAEDEYYRLLGWDVQSGIPTPECLEKLGLG